LAEKNLKSLEAQPKSRFFVKNMSNNEASARIFQKISKKERKKKYPALFWRAFAPFFLIPGVKLATIAATRS
jgi:hypothetical protein